MDGAAHLLVIGRYPHFVAIPPCRMPESEWAHVLTAEVRAKHHRRRCGPEGHDEPAEWNGMNVDQTLAQSEAGMCGPCDRKTSARAVVQPRHQYGICEFVG